MMKNKAILYKKNNIKMKYLQTILNNEQIKESYLRNTNGKNKSHYIRYFDIAKRHPR